MGNYSCYEIERGKPIFAVTGHLTNDKIKLTILKIYQIGEPEIKIQKTFKTQEFFSFGFCFSKFLSDIPRDERPIIAIFAVKGKTNNLNQAILAAWPLANGEMIS